ncbi:hypothetical protein M426DRAFT_16922 [Hypoxylon sp. CI-4A]|nr:hypothetical protein M426DRAFT_16922 [Hypoxylon sp. CI-4A]
MQSLAYLAVAAAAFLQGAIAVPASEPTTLPGHYVCTSITTVTTTKPPIGHCDVVCLTPTSTCKPGEPTEAPFPSYTTTPLPGCTVSVVVNERCECPTCVAGAGPAPTA